FAVHGCKSSRKPLKCAAYRTPAGRLRVDDQTMAQVILFLQQLLNGLSLGSIYALIALGYTMVYGVLRFINFAHGDIYMLGAYAGFAITNLVYLICPLDQFNAISRHTFVP